MVEVAENRGILSKILYPTHILRNCKVQSLSRLAQYAVSARKITLDPDEARSFLKPSAEEMLSKRSSTIADEWADWWSGKDAQRECYDSDSGCDREEVQENEYMTQQEKVSGYLQ